MVLFTDVIRRFGKQVALDGLNFEAHPGEIAGLLGPNGAGKTTTIRISSTIIQPHGGTAIVAGKDVLREPWQVRKNLGVLFENTGLYRRLTGIENVLYFARLSRIPVDIARKRAEDLFKRLEVDYAHRPAGEYSKGMSQRVALVGALVGDPPVAIFDEPTAGLDVASAVAVRSVLQDFAREGKTVVLSTHLMNEAAGLCSQVTIINKGKAVVSGSPHDICAKFDTIDLEKAFLKAVGK